MTKAMLCKCSYIQKRRPGKILNSQYRLGAVPLSQLFHNKEVVTINACTCMFNMPPTVNFSNSLIIQQVIIKEIITVTVVWKSELNNISIDFNDFISFSTP